MEKDMDKAIETVGLTRKFGDFVAVDRLDLVVRRGAFFGFLGPNGAGKSTTIRMLTGLLGVTAGRAALLGYDVARDPVEVKRRIGVVPEELALFDRLTGAEHLEFVGRMYGMPSGEARDRAGELLDLMGLQEVPGKLVVDYSHGMKKKLALCAALIHRPSVLFLDEPFEGIDALASRLIKDILRSLLDRGVTVFLTSHILEIVERLCTDLAVIHRGRLVAQGTLEELRAGVAFQNGGVAGEKKTLEEVFFSLLGGDNGIPKTLSWLE